MSVIGIDTATDAMGVGIGSTEGKLASGVVHQVPRGHSRLLQPSIDFVMRSAGVDVDDLERIGVGVGPGSYTGVRMAVATGKAMAHVLGIPIVPIPTLDAIAEAVRLAAAHDDRRDVRILAMLNARRGRAYGAIYTEAEGKLQRECEISVEAVDAWMNMLSAKCATAPGGAGTSVIVHDFPDAKAAAPPSAAIQASVLRWQSVSGLFPQALVRLTAQGDYKQLVGDDIHPFEPMYVLPVEAEAKLDLRQGGRSS